MIAENRIALGVPCLCYTPAMPSEDETTHWLFYGEDHGFTGTHEDARELARAMLNGPALARAAHDVADRLEAWAEHAEHRWAAKGAQRDANMADKYRNLITALRECKPL